MEHIKKISLSQKVKCELIDYIHSTGMRPNEMLPRECDLAEMLSVSRHTIREALALLEQERILYKVQGKGTFLKKIPSTIESGLEKLESVTDIIKKFGLDPSTEWCGISIQLPTEDMVKKLKIENDDEVVTFKRIRTANGEFAAYCIDSIPKKYLRYVPTEVNNESMMRFLSEEMNINMDSTVSYLEPSFVPDVIKRRFDFPENMMLIMFKQVHIDDSGKPIVYSYDYFNPELIKFYINRSR